MKNLLNLFVWCCLFIFSAQAQQSTCVNSIFTNGDLENGNPTNSHQDIGNATGFSRIWANNSWADYYPANIAPSGFPTPSPASGNYATCWIANHRNGGTTYREGFKAELDVTLPPNSGNYTLTFEAACLHGWGSAEIAVYALYNPSGMDAPNPPTGAYTPSNIALFGAANTQLIDVVPLTSSNCNGGKTTYTLTINTDTANFPENGATHIFVTHSDNQSIGGALFMGFDNFCIPEAGDVCTGSWVINGSLEKGNPTNSHQDIDSARGFSRIWQRGSWADYYTSTVTPSGFPTPNPASGNHATCWIANHQNGGRTYREGFKAKLTGTILPNTGYYTLTFDMSRLSGWGNSELAVYGISNSSGAYSANPTGAYTPSNMNLFGAANTVLLGTTTINSTTFSTLGNKSVQTIVFNSNAPSFPTDGMTHFFITHSDNQNINGSHFMSFDNFCLQSTKTVTCPKVLKSKMSCNKNGNYSYTFSTNGAEGSLSLYSNCGTFSPSTITLTDTTAYTVQFISNGSCGSNFYGSYVAKNVLNETCGRNRVRTTLPNCNECLCDRSFYLNVNQGFTYQEDCPKDKISPIALKGCDRVRWYVDGVYTTTSYGNAPIFIPHLFSSSEICMYVYRTTANGEECKAKVCHKASPYKLCSIGEIPVDARTVNITPNPATREVRVSWTEQDMPKNVTVGVFNSNGTAVKRLSNVNSFDNNVNVNIEELPSGLYYIRLEGEGYTTAPVKFVKK